MVFMADNVPCIAPVDVGQFDRHSTLGNGKDLSTCTLRVGKIVFSLGIVSIGLHGALSLFNAHT